jgi:uncharacterized alpha/beta hydrolase family protein
VGILNASVVGNQVEVLAIYGEYDTNKLPDADVITAAFKVGHKVKPPPRET